MTLWSLLTARTIFKIALQFMRGLYDSQHRPLISITTHFLLFCYVSDFRI